MVRDTGQDDTWEGTLLSTGNHGQVPVNAMQPLPYPFYQWATVFSSDVTKCLVYTARKSAINTLSYQNTCGGGHSGTWAG